MSIISGILGRVRKTDYNAIKDVMSNTIQDGVQAAQETVTAVTGSIAEKVDFSMIKGEDILHLKEIVNQMNETNEDLLDLARQLTIREPQLSHTLSSIVGMNRKSLKRFREMLKMPEPTPQPSSGGGMMSSEPQRPEGEIRVVTGETPSGDLLRGRVG